MYHLCETTNISLRVVSASQQRWRMHAAWIAHWLVSGTFRCYVLPPECVVEEKLTANFSCSVAARNSRITPSIKVTPGEAINCVVGFRSGEINVIVATSVIEEASY